MLKEYQERESVCASFISNRKHIKYQVDKKCGLHRYRYRYRYAINA